jgi:enamine deaminase RidA (YjgF/YER057c/UK114 family)
VTRIDKKLAELGIVLPGAHGPAGAYVSALRSGSYLFLGGQICREGSAVRYAGKVGADVAPETARMAARLCGLNLLGHLRKALDGDLDRVRRCVRLSIYLNCAPGFTDFPRVADGASELMYQIFGDAGQHVRTTVGVFELPFGAAVEVDGQFEVD